MEFPSWSWIAFIGYESHLLPGWSLTYLVTQIWIECATLPLVLTQGWWPPLSDIWHLTSWLYRLWQLYKFWSPNSLCDRVHKAKTKKMHTSQTHKYGNFTFYRPLGCASILHRWVSIRTFYELPSSDWQFRKASLLGNMDYSPARICKMFHDKHLSFWSL